MPETEIFAVKREAANGIGAASVDFVADNRKSRLGKMHPDLVLASRFQPHLDNRRFRTALHNVNMGNGKLTRFFLPR